MKNINFNVLWQKNRKFLLVVFGGFAVFLGLQSFAGSYRDGSTKVFDKSQKDVGKLVRAAEDLDQVYNRTISEQRVIDDHLEGFLEKVALSRSSRIKAPSDLNRAATDFPAKKDSVWDAFTDGADKINLRYPNKSKVSFDLRANLSDEDWIDRYRKLEVLQRVLQAANELRIDEILEIAPRPTMIEEIPDVPKRVGVRYPVKVKMRAPYKKLRSLFEYFQRDKVYLSVELDITQTDGEEAVADVLFSGIDIEEARGDDDKKGPGRWGRR